MIIYNIKQKLIHKENWSSSYCSYCKSKLVCHTRLNNWTIYLNYIYSFGSADNIIARLRDKGSRRSLCFSCALLAMYVLLLLWLFVSLYMCVCVKQISIDQQLCDTFNSGRPVVRYYILLINLIVMFCNKHAFSIYVNINKIN